MYAMGTSAARAPRSAADTIPERLDVPRIPDMPLRAGVMGQLAVGVTGDRGLLVDRHRRSRNRLVQQYLPGETRDALGAWPCLNPIWWTCGDRQRWGTGTRLTSWSSWPVSEVTSKSYEGLQIVAAAMPSTSWWNWPANEETATNWDDLPPTDIKTPSRFLLNSTTIRQTWTWSRAWDTGGVRCRSVSALLDLRLLPICRVRRTGSTDVSNLPFASTDTARAPSTTTEDHRGGYWGAVY